MNITYSILVNSSVFARNKRRDKFQINCFILKVNLITMIL